MYSTAFLDIPPLASTGGTVTLPGSKSISNRVLLLAALCSGTTTVHDLLDSDDTRIMLEALRQLGCSVTVTANTAVIGGLGGIPKVRHAKLHMGNAGTAMRPLAATLAMLGGHFELSGVPRMHERPIGDLVDALRQLGCPVEYLGNEGFPPLRVGSSGAVPVLHLEHPIQIRGDVSSQFLTALLMSLPLKAAEQNVVIEVVGELISRPYIEITLNLLARFGIQVQRDGWQRFTIPAGSRYRSPGTIHVEADASSASYFIALGALAAPTPGTSGIRINGVGGGSIQGDIRFIEAAQLMGATITSGDNWLHVARGNWPLKAIDLDCNHIPDAAMTLAVMALYADGTTTLRNIASWRVKETDRIAAMATELRKLGATVQEGADFIRVTPPESPTKPSPESPAPSKPRVSPRGAIQNRTAQRSVDTSSFSYSAAPVHRASARSGDASMGVWCAASIHTYDDHRVAMCFSLAAFNPAGLPVRIENPKCVAKTFPDYFEMLFSVSKAPSGSIPVICVDGPTASGKGTVAAALAARLGYHFLDSGAMYRVTALAALQAGLFIDAAHETRIAALAQTLPVRFSEGKILLDGVNVTEAIRTEEAGMNASRVSALPAVREALVALQHSFRQLPGLVADGRDMGTVIFPDAPLKVFLTASVERRAERRHKQLISKGISATLANLLADLEARDARDVSRSVSPLRPARDALLLDNSELTIDASVSQVLAWWQGKQPFQAS